MNTIARKIDTLRGLLAGDQQFPPLVRECMEDKLKQLLDPRSAPVLLADALGEIDRLQSVVAEKDATIAALVATARGPA